MAQGYAFIGNNLKKGEKVAPQTRKKSNFPTFIDFDKAMELQPNYKNCMAGSNVCYTRNLPEGVKPSDFIGLVKKLKS